MAAGDRVELRYSDLQSDHRLRSLRDRLGAAIIQVATRVRLHPASRVVQWQRLLADLDAANRRSVIAAMVDSLQRRSWDHPHRPHFRALVEARSFIEIVEQLSERLTPTDLKDLVSGPLDPSDERAQSRARDREFELFVAAICQRAGFATHLLEPDVVCDTPIGIRAIAAKRLTGPKRVGENVKKAAEQVARCGQPGYVFLDVTRVIEPHFDYVVHWRRSEFLAGKLLAFERNEHRGALARAANGSVRGIVLRVAFPYLAEGLRLGTYEIWHAVGVPGAAGADVDAFLHHYLRGLEGS